MGPTAQYQKMEGEFLALIYAITLRCMQAEQRHWSPAQADLLRRAARGATAGGREVKPRSPTCFEVRRPQSALLARGLLVSSSVPSLRAA